MALLVNESREDPAERESKKRRREDRDSREHKRKKVTSPKVIESPNAFGPDGGLLEVNGISTNDLLGSTQVESAVPKTSKESKEARRERRARKREAKELRRAKQETTVGKTVTSDTPYREDPPLISLPLSETNEYLTNNFISSEGHDGKVLRPIIDFKYLPKLEVDLERVLKNFKYPTPIQAVAWPYALSGRDVVGVAETGSGKTLAFGIPLAQSIGRTSVSGTRPDGVQALVVSPTRELALQIHAQLAAIADANDFKCVCIYGGMPKDEQRRCLKHAQVIVATPGRLNDFIQEGSADLSNVKYAVLDEADRMLDRGFEKEIRKIMSEIPQQRSPQVLMFTATWPQSIRELAATFMRNPVKISIGDNNPNGDLRANTSIKQIVEVVDPRGKETRLQQLLKLHQSGSKEDDRILVFCLYKKEATRIEGFIRSRGFNVAGIHGDMTQPMRTKSLDAFKAGTVSILVATDVAARGLDIPMVKVVINVTFPLTVEDYVHRIGRTGRAGNEGLAITLFTEHDKALSGALINVLKAAKQKVPPELLKFGGTVKKKEHNVYGAFYKDDAEGLTSTKITFD